MFVNLSEQKAADYLENAFKREFKDVHVLNGVVLPLVDNPPIATGEFDSIVVCNGGVFLFEVKGWNGCSVFRKKVDQKQQWFLENLSDGGRRDVRDPVAQGGLKIVSMKSYLLPQISVRSYVFLPEDNVYLGDGIPTAVITLQDLPYVARICRSGTKSVKYQKLDADAVNAVVELISRLGGGHSMAEHLDNCRSFNRAKPNLVTMAGFTSTSLLSHNLSEPCLCQ